MENLEKALYNAYEGTASQMTTHGKVKSQNMFFRQVWFILFYQGMLLQETEIGVVSILIINIRERTTLGCRIEPYCFILSSVLFTYVTYRLSLFKGLKGAMHLWLNENNKVRTSLLLEIARFPCPFWHIGFWQTWLCIFTAVKLLSTYKACDIFRLWDHSSVLTEVHV